MTIAFTASCSPSAQAALKELERLYGNAPAQEADTIVVLGGDGHVLQTLYAFLDQGKRVYAMRCTESVGFLCNPYNAQGLPSRLMCTQNVVLHPLKVACTTKDGSVHESLAINEVTLLRDSAQSAKLRVCVDGIERLRRYSGDGILIATPAGSTAYNHSAGGPIMPLDSNTLVMTAICGFRPRGWSYAVLPQSSVVTIDVIEPEKRPIRVESGLSALNDVVSVKLWMDCTTAFTLLFDPDQHLGEKIIREQFML